MRPTFVLWVCVVAVATGWSGAAFGQPGGAPPNYDFDWVTIGAVGNAPYAGPDPSGHVAGRGGVAYEYRISRLEVTTAQWMEFVNTFAGTSGPRPGFTEYIPVFWGAAPDPSYQGPGERWRLNPGLPQAAMLPVGGISWRDAAMYCNWLQSGKSSDPSALATGAYDTSTWGQGPGGTFTDGATHLPGAQFWIPTLDEWLKSAHFDSERFGPGQPGWWQYNNRSDSPPMPGPPGIGTSSAGWDDPQVFNGQWLIPLGAYPQSVSPWGLLDTSGGAEEWTEFVFWPGYQYNRGLMGAYAGDPLFQLTDQLTSIDGLWPYSRASSAGVRIVSAVPAPGAGMAMVCGCLVFRRRRRERWTEPVVGPPYWPPWS